MMVMMTMKMKMIMMMWSMMPMMTKMLMISSMRLHVFIDFGVSHEEGLEATHDIVLRLCLSDIILCFMVFSAFCCYAPTVWGNPGV